MLNEDKLNQLKALLKKRMKLKYKYPAKLTAHRAAQAGTDVEHQKIAKAALRAVEQQIFDLKTKVKAFESHDIEGAPTNVFIASKLLAIIPIEELQTTYKDHERLTVFANKGVECIHPDCDRVGVKLVHTIDEGGREHIDLVTEDFKLMTVDHIKPKSKGGGEELENKQCLCYSHNIRKSNKLVPY